MLYILRNKVTTENGKLYIVAYNVNYNFSIFMYLE
jgi:hypothetical protein